MSWLNVRGKLYHCVKCNEEITGFLNSYAPSNQIEIDEDEWIGKLKNRLEALPF